jgi:uncharacterized protein with NRDE domain
MCTVIILNEYHDKYKLIVAANRDELYDKPSAPPELLQGTHHRILAPKDLINGGTWIGVTEDGWFAAITNQDDDDYNSGMKSRGNIVAECLQSGNSHDVASDLRKLDPQQHNSFNLIFGSADDIYIGKVHRGNTPVIDHIHTGITVIGNDCSDKATYQRKIDHATELARTINHDDSISEMVNKLHHILSDHSNSNADPYEAICVHDEQHKFGTVSSCIIAVTREGVVEYYHSEGFPCRANIIQLIECLNEKREIFRLSF